MGRSAPTFAPWSLILHPATSSRVSSSSRPVITELPPVIRMLGRAMSENIRDWGADEEEGDRLSAFRVGCEGRRKALLDRGVVGRSRGTLGYLNDPRVQSGGGGRSDKGHGRGRHGGRSRTRTSDVSSRTGACGRDYTSHGSALGVREDRSRPIEARRCHRDASRYSDRRGRRRCRAENETLAALGGAARSYGFFHGRRRLDTDLSSDDGADLAEYPNVSPLIGLALSCGNPRVTLHELQTVYGLEDLYDMLEVCLVNSHNERILAKVREKNTNPRGSR